MQTPPTIQIDTIPRTAAPHGAVGQPLLRAGNQNLCKTVCLLVRHQGTFPEGSEDIDRFPLALPDEGSGSSDGSVENLDLGGSEGIVVGGGKRGNGIGARGLFGFAMGVVSRRSKRASKRKQGGYQLRRCWR